MLNICWMYVSKRMLNIYCSFFFILNICSWTYVQHTFNICSTYDAILVVYEWRNYNFFQSKGNSSLGKGSALLQKEKITKYCYTSTTLLYINNIVIHQQHFKKKLISQESEQFQPYINTISWSWLNQVCPIIGYFNGLYRFVGYTSTTF